MKVTNYQKQYKQIKKKKKTIFNTKPTYEQKTTKKTGFQETYEISK